MYLDSQIYEIIQYYRTIYLQISNFMLKMKKSSILFATTLSLCSLMSCNKLSSGLETPYVAREGEIYFGSKGLAVSTKAVTETTASALQTNGFNTAVCIDNDDNDVMFNEKLTYESGIWKVSGKTFYYPAVNTISAYAVYPTGREITIESGVATVAYTQNATEDLVVAQALNISKQADAIELAFQHVLAQVKVKCKGLDGNADYELKTLELTAPASGTYQFADDQWADLGDATAYTYYNNAGAAVSTSAMQAFGESMTFVPSQVTIRAVWDCKNKVDHTVVGTYDQSVTATLTSGNCSTFNLSLPNADAAEITFTVSVEDWDSEEQNIVMGENVAQTNSQLLPFEISREDDFGNVNIYSVYGGNVYYDGQQYRVETKQYSAADLQPGHKALFTLEECGQIAAQFKSADVFELIDFAASDLINDGDTEYEVYSGINVSALTVDGVRGIAFNRDGGLPQIGGSISADEFSALEKDYNLVFLAEGWYYTNYYNPVLLQLDDPQWGVCIKYFSSWPEDVKYMFRPVQYQMIQSPVMSFNIFGDYECSYFGADPEQICPNRFQSMHFTFDRSQGTVAWKDLTTLYNTYDSKTYEVFADGGKAYILLPYIVKEGFQKVALGRLDEEIPTQTSNDNTLYYSDNTFETGAWSMFLSDPPFCDEIH